MPNEVVGFLKKIIQRALTKLGNFNTTKKAKDCPVLFLLLLMADVLLAGLYLLYNR